MTSSDTRSSILNVAQRLVLILGFDDFSHAEIRAEGSVHTSTIYYYFSTSGDLGREMFVRYFKISLRLTYMTQRLNDQKKPNP